MVQTPLGVNVLASLLQNVGIGINATAVTYMGTSTNVSTYVPGTIYTATCLGLLTQAIRLAYLDPAITPATYIKLLAIGAASIPALGNAVPSTYTQIVPYDKTNEITSHGFVRLFALQAYDEFNYNGTYAIAGEYRDFLSSFTTAANFIDYSNSTILTINNSITFLDGTYSNMNDLTSSDITGVSLSTTLFGQDLIALGKAINLASIATYGLPSNLLKTINQYNAITQSLSLALLASGLTVAEITQILKNSTPTTDQQRKIYGAFMIIVGQDLRDVLVPLNCKTAGLISLADLLNPLKLFPLSYQTLTVPVYNITQAATNSKIYYQIYENGGVNSRLTSPQLLSQIGTQVPAGTPNIVLTATQTTQVQPAILGFGSYAQNILPASVATAAGAFAASMLQINNISKVLIEKFAQVVISMETTKGLDLINGTTVPVDTASAITGQTLVGLGSGPHGSYTMSNFFGCMSGLPYGWGLIQTLITSIQTPTLSTIYTNLFNAVVASDDLLTQTYITAANVEIASIQTANPVLAQQLNTIWSTCGSQLGIEQQARLLGLPVLPVPRDNNLSTFPTSQYSFTDVIPSYALSTEPHMYAQTIEAIADMTTVGGQSIVGLMRETRNKSRLNSTGIAQYNTIPSVLPETERTTLIANGVLPSTVPAYPANVQAYGFYVPATNSYQITNNSFNVGVIDTGAATEPGSFAGSLYRNMIPAALDAIYTSDVLQPATMTVPEAMLSVFTCNCTCWAS